jgi:hypothetical protein
MSCFRKFHHSECLKFSPRKGRTSKNKGRSLDEEKCVPLRPRRHIQDSEYDEEEDKENIQEVQNDNIDSDSKDDKKMQATNPPTTKPPTMPKDCQKYHQLEHESIHSLQSPQPSKKRRLDFTENSREVFAKMGTSVIDSMLKNRKKGKRHSSEDEYDTQLQLSIQPFACRQKETEDDDDSLLSSEF